MAAKTEKFRATISMELQRGGQKSMIIDIVYEKPKDDSSHVHFEFQDKTFKSVIVMSKDDFCLIDKQGHLSRFDRANSKEKQFAFQDVEFLPPRPERRYLGCISVSCNQNDELEIIPMAAFPDSTAIRMETQARDGVQRRQSTCITASRLANERLKIDWRLDHLYDPPKELIIEYPGVQKNSKIKKPNGNDNTVQTIVYHEEGSWDSMYLGHFDKTGDSFSIQGIEKNGSVVVPLNPEHSSLIGVFYYGKCGPILPDYVVIVPNPEPETNSAPETMPTLIIGQIL